MTTGTDRLTRRAALAGAAMLIPAFMLGAPAMLHAQDAELAVTLPAAEGRMELLKWGVPYGEPASLDPSRGNDNSPAFVASNTCDPLLRLTPDYGLEPGLAESWEFGDDNLTLTFHLRDDVLFSDGSPMTAEDVVFSLSRHMDPAVGSVYGSSVYGSVDKIEATGASEVTVSFKTPDALFLSGMSNVSGHVVSKQAAEAAGKAFGSPSGLPVCTGVYKIDEWVPGSGIRLSENPHFWDDAHRPHAEKVSLQFISDAASLTQALKAGAIDGSYEVPPAAIAALKDAAGEVHFGPSPVMLFVYAAGPGPLEDVHLRRALDLLINRDAIAARVYHGAAVADDRMVPPILWGGPAQEIYQEAAAQLPKAEPDLDAARAELEKAAPLDRPLKLIITAGNEPMRLIATLLIEQARELGITIEVEQVQPTDNAALFSNAEFRAGFGADLIMINGWSAIAEPLFYPRRVVLPGGIFNLVGYENDEVTALVTKGIEAFDDDERARLFTEAQALYEPDKPLLPIVNLHEVLFLRDGLTGATTSFAYLYSPSLAHIGPES